MFLVLYLTANERYMDIRPDTISDTLRAQTIPKPHILSIEQQHENRPVATKLGNKAHNMTIQQPNYLAATLL